MHSHVSARINPPLTAFLVVVAAAATVVLFILALGSLLGTPGRDSSVFIYVAEGILYGKVPYLDRWDHKPPLIYAINLAGLLVSGGHIWGVWLLEGLFLLGSVWIAFVVLRENFGIAAAAISIPVFLHYFIELNEGGNFTEQYALLFQFFALYLFVATERQDELKPWLPLAIGVLAAAAFLLRPNLVGLWIAIGLHWILWTRSAPRYIAWAVAGAGTVFLLLFCTLTVVGGWSAFLDAVFAYSIAYSGAATFMDKIEAAKRLTEYLHPLFPLLVTAWVIGLYYCLSQEARHARYKSLLLLALIWLPIEVVLISSSGRQYLHYYMTILPVFSVFLAFSVSVIIASLLRRINQLSSDRVHTNLLVSLASLAVVVVTAIYLQDEMRSVVSHIELHVADGEAVKGRFSRVVERVHATTAPGDTILVWGAESQIYLFSERMSPTRFFYQYPLVTPGYASAAVFDEFISDINANKPAMIIDTRNILLPPLDRAERLIWQSAEQHGERPRYTYSQDRFHPFFTLVERKYQLTEQVDGYAIYRRIG